MNRKKKSNPKYILLKAKIASIFIILMCATLMVVKIGHSSGFIRNAQPAPQKGRTADELLDSLIKVCYPEGTTILSKGNNEYITIAGESLKENDMGTGYYRRIKIKTIDGQEYTFLQKCDTAFTHSTAHWIMNTSDLLQSIRRDAEKELKKEYKNK